MKTVLRAYSLKWNTAKMFLLTTMGTLLNKLAISSKVLNDQKTMALKMLPGIETGERACMAPCRSLSSNVTPDQHSVGSQITLFLAHLHVSQILQLARQ
jgi:hypothetical protein